MMNKTQTAEMIRLATKELKTGEDREKKDQFIDQFQETSDVLTEGWGKVFNSFPEMIKMNPPVFANPQKINELMNEVLPMATAFLNKGILFSNKYSEFNEKMTTYFNDQNDIIAELTKSINVDKNLFTLNSNQVMRLPELVVVGNKLYNECLTLNKEMMAIEKIVSFIRLPVN
jgi:hypothetical protein